MIGVDGRVRGRKSDSKTILKNNFFRFYLPLKTPSRYELPGRRKELEHFKSSCLENTKK